MKENVITGKLIPAGTGLIPQDEEEEKLEEWTVADAMKHVKQQYIEKHDRKDAND